MLPEDDDFTINLAATLTPNQRDVFYQEYGHRAKKYHIALALCLLGGWVLGFHKFYLGRIGQGILYILLGPTSIAFFLTIFDIINLRATVTKINREIAGDIAERVRSNVSE